MTNETKNKPHPYHQVLQWVAEGKELETYSHYYKKWFTADNDNLLVCIGNPNHSSISTYISPIDIRLKPERHIHQDLIDAYENGAKIQCWSTIELVWVNCFHPYWNIECKYRIKPEPKPDIVRYVHITKEHSVGIASCFPSAWVGAVLEVTLCGETGEIKHSKKYQGDFND